MAKKIVFTLALVCAFTGCGGKEDGAEAESSLGGAVSAISKLDDVADASKNMEKHLEDLKKLTPLTNEQLKSALPESLGGVARSNFEINSALGMHVADAKYEKESSAMELQIVDGAGEMGASMVAMAQLASAMGSESESQTGYLKPFSVGGAKGSEKQDKTDANNVLNEITLIVGNRYVLTVKSRNTNMDALKAAITESQVIDKLGGLK